MRRKVNQFGEISAYKQIHLLPSAVAARPSSALRTVHTNILSTFVPSSGNPQPLHSHLANLVYARQLHTHTHVYTHSLSASLHRWEVGATFFLEGGEQGSHNACHATFAACMRALDLSPSSADTNTHHIPDSCSSTLPSFSSHHDVSRDGNNNTHRTLQHRRTRPRACSSPEHLPCCLCRRRGADLGLKEEPAMLMSREGSYIGGRQSGGSAPGARCVTVNAVLIFLPC